jgi:hypothetical protein
MLCQSDLPWFDHSNYIWRRVQVTKLLIIWLSSASRHFSSLRSKYSPQHPVLKQVVYPKNPSRFEVSCDLS